MRMSIWLVLFIVVAAMALFGQVWRLRSPDSSVQVHVLRNALAAKTVFVLFHGFDPVQERLHQTTQVLLRSGDVLRVEYPAELTSNADPDKICDALKDALEEPISRGGYTRVVLVAHSAGALLARRTLLDGLDAHRAWPAKVRRVVLLAGMNRGWNSPGPKPLDLSAWTEFKWRAGAWFGKLAGIGEFIASLEAGTPFVANLRLDWMRRTRDGDGLRDLEVVQLLGDIDNVVSSADNEDLKTMESSRYALLRVRGTGHGDIIDFGAATKAEERGTTAESAPAKLARYRRDKLLLAIDGSFDEVLLQNESLPPATDDKITSVVFVLHGIRDLGRWSSEFEGEIRKAGKGEHAVIVSPRYGYLGMGPFLLPEVRERHVRWFMDQYTEVLARYPTVKAKDIEFFGHSNGTYLLAAALERYESMRIGRVVFAGSVVRKDYGWKRLIDLGRVGAVRNYVATDDWVVALFPRLFELRPVSWLGDDVGSAGFNGFDEGGGCPSPAPASATANAGQALQNVCYIDGAHGAFDQDERVKEIVGFLLSETSSPAQHTFPRGSFGTVMGWSPTVWLVWSLIVVAIGYVGLRVVSAAPAHAWVPLVLFVLLVVRVLQTV